MNEPLYLCATTRLAQTLRIQAPEGATAWRACRAMTLGQWLGSLAEEAGLTGIADLPDALDPFAESLLWEKLIGASLNAASPLFDLAGMAASAAEAHALSRIWGIRPQTEDCSDEARLFLGWQAAFEAHCRDAGWIDGAGLHGQVLDLIDQGCFALPEAVVFAGFDRLTPQEEALAEALKRRRVSFQFWPEMPVDRQAGGELPPAANVRAIACADVEAECRAVAAWAKSRLDADPSCRLGIVAPGLGSVRDGLEFALDDALHPALIRAEGAEAQRLFNFSLGRVLADVPLVSVALDLLALGGGRAKVEQSRLSALLLAGGWSAAMAEADGRARLDAAMRRDLPYFTTLPALLRLAERFAAEAPACCPQSVAALQALLDVIDQLPRKQLPSAWARGFQAALAAVDWPGDRPLSSHEFQARRAFREVLAGFGKLDSLLGSIGMNEAVRRLRQLCRQRIFQPETRGRPAVQVLGVLESAGLQFDALWVMGMNDDQWPPPPRPNPLLPAAALRAARAAHACAEVELDFARRVHDRLLLAAPEVTFSWAQAEGNRIRRPSPLLAELTEDYAPEPVERLAERLARRAGEACEQLADAVAPPVGEGEKVSGGSWVLRAQAICPAWAYYQFRLGAEAMDEPVEGLDPAARGTLVHAALEAFWKATGSSAALVAMNEAKRQQTVADAVVSAIEGFERDRRISLPARFRELEAARLQRLLTVWLALEAQRSEAFEVLACEAPAEIEIEGIRVKMVVDRIDRLADGREIIIDYKTGASIDTRNWAAMRITEPQLPIYAALVNDAVAAVVFAKVLIDRPAFSGVADAGNILPGVPGVGDDKQKIFSVAEFPDWQAVIAHWRERLHAVAREVGDGVAGVMFADEQGLQYCEVLPLLRLPERRRLLAAAGPPGDPRMSGC